MMMSFDAGDEMKLVIKSLNLFSEDIIFIGDSHDSIWILGNNSVSSLGCILSRS